MSIEQNKRLLLELDKHRYDVKKNNTKCQY